MLVCIDSSLSTPSQLLLVTMAKFRSNIWGKAAGSIGGIVFSEARDRQGKVQTARQRVVPLNPQTPAQQIQRQKMQLCTAIANQVGIQDLRLYWDRAVSKLPGFQSLVSAYQRTYYIAGTVILGDREMRPYFLGDYPGVELTSLEDSGTPGVLDFSWSTSVPPGGASSDNLHIVASPMEMDLGEIGPNAAVYLTNFRRSDGSAVIDMRSTFDPDQGALVVVWVSPQEPVPSGRASVTSSIFTYI